MEEFILRYLGILIVALWSLGVWAGDTDQTWEMKFVGNEKTKDSYLHFLVNKCLRESENFTPPKVEQCLINSKHFAKVEVKVLANHTLEVKVEERWTLIPLPFFRSQHESRSGGIFILDSHFLGMGKLLGLGVTLSNRGDTYVLFYRDPAIFYSSWTSSITLRHFDQDHWRYEIKVKREGYHEKGTALDTSLGYKLDSHWTVSALVSGQKKEATALSQLPLTTKIKNREDQWLALGTSLSYNNSLYQFYFQEGLQISLSASTQVKRTAGTPTVNQGGVMGEWQKKIWNQHALQLAFAYQAISGGDARDTYKGGGRGKPRGIPATGLWAKELLTSSIDYQIPLFHPSYGTWTLAPFVEETWAKIYQSSQAENYQEQFTAFGIGGYLFLRNVALPGMGLVLGKNSKYEGEFVSFSVGMSM